MNRTEILQATANSMLGMPYLWGGKCRLVGLDCSGFICECLRSVGLIGLHEDLSAQALYDRFAPKKLQNTGTGFLVFFGKYSNAIDHVGIVMDLTNNLMVEAGGGDHTVTSLDIAKAKQAFVRYRQFASQFAIIAI